MQARMRIGMVRAGIVALSVIVLCGDNARAQTNQTAVSPLSEVSEYCVAHYKNTTLKNSQVEKDLVGRVYTGTVDVRDVAGDDKKLKIVGVFPDSAAAVDFEFDVKDDQAMKTAAALNKGAKVSLTAKLRSFGFSSRGRDTVWFEDTKNLAIVTTGKEP